MDKDGEPLDMTDFGSVYIKYNSLATERDGPGTASLAGCVRTHVASPHRALKNTHYPTPTL